MEDTIIIGKTKNKATVSICINCESYNTPHFNYSKGKKHYSIEFERAVTLDHGKIMELKERTDLEIFFATFNEKYNMTNWQLTVKTWNENNQIQIPNNLHKPYYRNMVEGFDDYIISTKNNRTGLLDDTQIFCNEEVETEPHFHIKLKDNADVAIYFDKAEYLEPLQRTLTNEELDIIIKYLKQKCNIKFFKDYTNWQYLIYAWNNQNANTMSFIFPAKEGLDVNMQMPDFRMLNKE